MLVFLVDGVNIYGYFGRVLNAIVVLITILEYANICIAVGLECVEVNPQWTSYSCGVSTQCRFDMIFMTYRAQYTRTGLSSDENC